MPNGKSKQLADRVTQSAETLLQRNGSVGPLELLAQLGFLAGVHLVEWQKGNAIYNPLQPHIQCGDAKLQKTYQLFLAWATEKKLEPMEASYSKASRDGAKTLRISAAGDLETETFFRTHYRSGNLTPARKKQLEKKLNKVPDLVVFQLTSPSSQCHECTAELVKGDLIFMEDKNALCLSCADMDHLEFLPSSNVAMTRRSKKHSPLSAVVVRFNARRKRYERQGILVTSSAIDAAEEQCNADAEQRAARRDVAAHRRSQDDEVLIAEMTQRILAQYPGCPTEEANQIAAHTAIRGSGRVGRSAAGRELNPAAIALAVGAWVRHQHTEYDTLLMNGTERQTARSLIRDRQQSVLTQWKS